MRCFARHRGATLVELILYMGILGMVAVLTIPLLFTTAENRMLQQTIAIVELNGTQAVQTVSLYVRAAERILYPPLGQTGSFLALQMAEESESPILFGVDSSEEEGGRMAKIEHTMRELFTSPQVSVQDFVVRNTSASEDRPGVAITFRVSRTIRLEQPRSYHRDFETAVSLSPVDVLAARNCTPGIAPVCVDASTVQWRVCTESSPGVYGWMNATTTLVCE